MNCETIQLKICILKVTNGQAAGKEKNDKQINLRRLHFIFNGIKLTNDCVHLNTILWVYLFFSLSPLLSFTFVFLGIISVIMVYLIALFNLPLLFFSSLLKASRISFEIRFYVAVVLIHCLSLSLSMHTKLIMFVQFKRIIMIEWNRLPARCLTACLICNHTQIFKCRHTIDHH